MVYESNAKQRKPWSTKADGVENSIHRDAQLSNKYCKKIEKSWMNFTRRGKSRTEKGNRIRNEVYNSMNE
jgi:hypothetical protein